MATSSDKDKRVKALENDLLAAHQVVETGKIMLRAFQQRPEFSTTNSLPRSSQARDRQREQPRDATAENNDDDDDPETGGTGGGWFIGGFGAVERMLEAVQGQRDRFKKEARTRESELALLKSITEQLQSKCSELERDNMVLYKKIRYVRMHAPGEESADAGGAVENKYAREYEASLNPFLAWEKKEVEGAHERLGPLDRLLLKTLRLVVTSRIGRLALVAYLVFLHFMLVFG
mmetsp:Transcript_578/g.772  ORF Transcript_578/g.772 Transcript_578/m.772 type:complete len:233 (-) Transcript_578:149-847(-)